MVGAIRQGVIDINNRVDRVLAPVVGIPMPLLSFGGTVMITVMIGLGLILLCYFVYRLLRQPAKEIAEEITHKEEIRQK